MKKLSLRWMLVMLTGVLPLCGARAQVQPDGSEMLAEGVIYRSGAIVAKLGVPQNDKPIKIDGKIGEDEWFAASATTGFMDNLEREYSQRQTIVYACYDKSNLYLAFDSKLSEKPDGDAITVALNAGDGLQRFRLTPGGKVAGIAGTNASGVEAASTLDANRWVCEVRVPASKPLASGAIWKANFVRTFGAPRGFTSWVGKTDTSDDFAPDELGQLLLRDDIPYAKITSLGAINEGRLNVQGTIYQKAAAAGAQRQTLFLDLPLTDEGRVNTLSRFSYYQSGELTKLAITPAENQEELKNADGKTIFTNRNAQASHFTLRAESWQGPVLFETDYVPTGRKFPPVEYFTLKVLPENKLVIWLETLGIKPEQVGQLTLKSEIISPAGKVLQTRTVPKARRGDVEVEFDASLLSPGDNKFRAQLLDASGKSVAQSEKVIVKPDEKLWKGNTLGISDKVPTPFEPVKRSGNTLTVWGREYSLGNGAFSAIKANGEELLATPMKIEATSGGKPIDFKPGAWQWQEVKDTQAIAVQEWTSATLDIAFKITLEYDGMARCDMTLRPKAGGATLDSLAFSMAMPTRRALYLNWTRSTSGSDRAGKYSGAVPKDGWESEFVPFVWLGDNERGLLWFAESARHWNLAKKGTALQVTPRGDTVEFRAQMMDRATKLNAPTTITFGLQASPVKPLPSGWRDWHRHLTVYASPVRGRDGYLPEIMKHESQKIVDRSKSQGKPVAVYTYPRFLDTTTPAYTFFANQWRAGGPLLRRKTSYVQDQMSPSTGFTEFNIWAVSEALKTRPAEMKGLVYDLGWVGPSLNPDVSYKDENGVMQPTWEIFGLRNYYKRVYTLMREAQGQTFILVNTAGSAFELPLFSFVDATWDGEQFAQYVKDYIGDVPLDYWRAELSRRQFGNIPLFLGIIRYWNPGEAEDKANYTMLTMTLLHDLLIFGSHAKGEIVEPFEKAKEAFNVAADDVKYIPYWQENGKIFKAADKSLLFSSYVRPGKALIVVGNTDEKDAAQTITVDWKTLGVTPKTVQLFDGVKTQDVPLENGTIKIKVAGKHPVFLLVNQK